MNGLFFISYVVLATMSQDMNMQKIQCSKRFFKHNSFVCVCNSTYCDTIEPIDDTIDKKLNYQEYVTSRAEFRLEKFIFQFENQRSPLFGSLRLTINRKKLFQTIFGFGGAITDATSLNINKLSKNSVSNFLSSYFEKTGLEYNILRVPMAGTDFSNRTYTYDDSLNDFDLKNFSLSYEDTELKIPFIQSALKQSRKKIKLFASAWSAPPWMKKNNDFKGKGILIGPAGGKYYQTWANYYLKFFQEYQKFNIKFWALTAQNEPNFGYLIPSPVNQLGFSAESQAEFVISNLGPTLEKNGFGDLKIMILDDSRIFLPTWANKVFDYSPEKTNKYISGIAVHWYTDMFTSPSFLDRTNQKYPSKFIFGTEACAGFIPTLPAVLLGDFGRAESYAKYILQDLNHWVTGWTDWNMALDMEGGPNWTKNFVESPVIVNYAADEFYKQPIFYIMGHFSKFIPENSTRIEVTSSEFIFQYLVSYAAFDLKDLRQTTLILLNDGEMNFPYSIYDPTIDKYINGDIAAHSIKTIAWFY